MAGVYGKNSEYSSSPLLAQWEKANPNMNVASQWLNVKGASWAADTAHVFQISDDLANELQIPQAANGNYYMTPNDFATFVMASQSGGLGTVPDTAINSLIQRLSTNNTTATSYLKAGNIFDAANAAITSGKFSVNKNWALTAQPSELNNISPADTWAASSGKAKTGYTAWVSSANNTALNPQDPTMSYLREASQYDKISQFLDQWPGANTPATQKELYTAIFGKGMFAANLEQLLYKSNSADKNNPIPQLTASFQKAFPALVNAYKTGQPIGVSTPAEYMKMVSDYQNALIANGMPASTLTTAQLDTMMANHVNPSDLAARVQMAYNAYQQADPQVRNLLENKWGVDPTHAVSYILNAKNEQEIQDQITSSNLYKRGGLGSTGVTQAATDRLAGLQRQGLVGQSESNAAIDRAAAMQGLQSQSFGLQNQRTASADTAMASTNAAIAGDAAKQAQAATQIGLAQEERTQANKAGGQMATSQSGGVSGAGRVN